MCSRIGHPILHKRVKNMRKTRYFWLVTISVLMCCLNPQFVKATPIQYSQAATGISLTVDFANGTTQEFSGLEGENVFEVTNSATSVEVEWYGDLVFVTAISGVSQDPDANLYWQYWVNDELGSSAANKFILHDGDSIEWRLPTSESDTTDGVTEPPFDLSLLMGSAILGVVAVLFLVVLKIRTDRR